MDKKRISDKRPTLRDVAAALGVTTTTVSNAYNRPDQLSASLRESVLAAAAKLGYAGPDPAARSLRRGRSVAVGVVYADPLSYAFADPAFVLFLEGLASAVEELGVSLTLMPGTPRDDPTTSPVMTAIVDAFVVYSMADDDPLFGAAKDRRLPMIRVDAPVLDGRLLVSIDDRGGAEAAAAHVLGLGHESIGVISCELTSQVRPGPVSAAVQAEATHHISRARLAGYAAACGARWSEVPVFETARNSEAGGAEAARWLLDRKPRPTAILAMSDRLAAGAMEVARERGLRIPGDLSIAGFDDVPLASASNPGLTSVRQPHAEKGRSAGQLVMAVLAGRRIKQPAPLPTELVVRGSTARPRKAR
ncbi:LacI family DNA-binding transcriptional regulator [Pendulispora rubella]|uniref:LacI family DNA-binding transcriptional regulator n=1 Tax=Pendulispora rubella TaxID=2741070 RepID=A0ABZ2KQ72_9BACT